MEWVRETPARGRSAVSPLPLQRGTSLPRFSSEPYAACLLPSLRTTRCALCFSQAATPASKQQSSTLSRCSRCRWVRYCSSRCQREDWPSHKHECPSLASRSPHSHLLTNLPDSTLSDLLLLSRCGWRRHSPHPVSPEDLAFDALSAGKTEQGDVELARLATTLDGWLPPALCGCDGVSAVSALLAAFRVNNFGITNELHSVVGAGCYPAAALLNHSCKPNCLLFFDGRKIQALPCRDWHRESSDWGCDCGCDWE